MVRFLTTVALTTAALVAAAPAAAAVRPGSFESEIASIAPNNDARALGVTPDQRIVVAGVDRIALARSWVRAYLPGGGPDSTFGDGGEVRFESEFREVAALAIQPDGRILLAETGSPGWLHRLNPDGSRDTSFGSAGTLSIEFGAASHSRITDVAIQPDGRILAVSTDAVNGPQPVDIRRYLPDGSADPSFGTNGQVLVSTTALAWYSTVALQPDGRIVLLVQGGDPPLRIARLSVDGHLDASFGGGGLAPIELGRRGGLAAVTPAVGSSWHPLTLSDGRVRIPVTFGPSERVFRVALVGLTAAGHPDLRFGRRGLALGPRQAFAEGGEWPRAAVRDEHGGILVTGSLASGDDLSGEDSTIVRRFRRDGSLDLSFGRLGLVRGTLPGSGALEQQLGMLDADTVVLAEEATTPKYQTWHGGTVRTLYAGYDRSDPAISISVRGCRTALVEIEDISGVETIVRVNGRVVRSTHRKRFRVRARGGGGRVSVVATDLADNSTRRRARLPRC